MKEIVIKGRFASLNEYVAACRRNQYAGAGLIKKTEKEIISQLHQQRLKPFDPPVHISYTFYEKNRRRDHDNVSGFFHKVFQDSLVKAHLLPDDGWNEITGYSDSFRLDREPHVVIRITEMKKQNVALKATKQPKQPNG